MVEGIPEQKLQRLDEQHGIFSCHALVGDPPEPCGATAKWGIFDISINWWSTLPGAVAGLWARCPMIPLCDEHSWDWIEVRAVAGPLGGSCRGRSSSDEATR